TGLPSISLGFFSAASEAVAIPTAVQIFVFIATLWAGRVVWSTPLMFGAGALAIFVVGGLTGVMVAVAPFDWQAHDTYFIVAHLHYVLIGGAVLPLFAGLYYYWPMVTGKKLSDRLGRAAFWLMFVGFNVAFFPMHISGLAGMPRRVFTYPEGIGLDLPNLVSSIGAFVLALGVAFVLVDLALSPPRPRGSRHPWAAGTLEWLARPDEHWGVLGAARREPLSAVGPGGLRRAPRRGPLLLAGRGRGPARALDLERARREAAAGRPRRRADREAD